MVVLNAFGVLAEQAKSFGAESDPQLAYCPSCSAGGAAEGSPQRKLWVLVG